MSETNFNAEYSGYVATFYVYTDYVVANDLEEGDVISPGDLKVGQAFNNTTEKWYIARSFIWFDTSTLPDNCLIKTATLTVTGIQQPDLDFNLIIQKGDGTYPHNPLQNIDYNRVHYSGNGGSENTAGSAWTTITLNSTGRSWINKTGYTILVLRSESDINYTERDEAFIMAKGYTETPKPQLTIEYYTPTETPAVDDPTFSDLRKNSVLATANITNDGEIGYEERGFEYGLTETATWTKKETGLFTGTGEFSLTLSEEISLPKTYYVRAYAKNSIGTGYSNWVKFEVVAYPEEGDWVAYIGYGEWVKFMTAAPGTPGDKPSGYKNDICSDDSGYTYILNRSLTDDGASYESHFTLSTDLSGKKTLHTNKRLLDIFSYFANKGTGTAKVYVKRDNEPAWQYAGEISLAGEEEIIIKHLPSENEDSEGDVDYLAKHYLIKFLFENDFEFIGMITEAVGIGDR